jgi:hypothetical protein
MFTMNPVLSILVENAKTYAERNEIFSLTESGLDNVNNTMIANLYKSAIDKSYIDFEDIPQSKGDITKYSGYRSMMSVVNIIKEITTKSGIKIPELDTVDTALSNIVTYRESFEKGFKLDKEFVILHYNILVYACVESISSIISSYVDFIKRPDQIEFMLIKNTKVGNSWCIDNLNKFNMSVKKGDFSKAINGVNNSGKEGFVGVDDLIIPTLIIGGVLVLVPIMRQLIFFFYYSKMRLSDYLKQQAMFLEINKQNLEANSNIPAKKKNEIIKNQEKAINDLNSLSDKVKVNNTMTQNKASTELNKENKSWTIGDVKSQAASTDQNGFKLL